MISWQKTKYIYCFTRGKRMIAPQQYQLRGHKAGTKSFSSHTIFINVTTKIPVHNLVGEIRAAQRLMKLDNEHKPHFIDEPFIVIGRKLVPWQFEKGWLEFSHRQFTGSFIADNMLLLKRRLGDRSWMIAQRFEFMNLPVTTKQGELFV